MLKKLTITLDEEVIGKDLQAAYSRMVQEEAREAEALAWAEATLEDVADEAQ